MSFKIRLVMFIFSILLIVLIGRNLKRDKMSVKYAMVWFSAALLILLVSILPSFLNFISSFLGFEAMASMVTGMMFVIILMILMILTIIISNQKKVITTLIQEVSLLKGQSKK